MEQETAYRLIFDEYPDVVNIHQLCDMLGGIGIKTAYGLVKTGRIKRIGTGRTYRIPKINVINFLNVIE
ncbi:MAG: helix-turn-helix domain-containing protein [Ruminococcaceae bacterium]|nr:helix-turn-helix domain-containing protein [Oscillospiraceae bacterium]